MRKKMEWYSIRISQDDKNKLFEHAKKREISAAFFVNCAIEEKIKRYDDNEKLQKDIKEQIEAGRKQYARHE